MPATIAIYAWCRKCGARRIFDRVSLAGYACKACGAPKPKRSPILKRDVRP